MHIPSQTVHDIKTERADVLPPLTNALRLIPIAFYLTAFFTVLLLGLTVFQIREATAKLEDLQRQTRETQLQSEETRKARSELEGRAKLAADVLQWVEGATAIQPLAVAIGRSMGTRAAITELTLSRDEKASRQIQLAIKMQSADALQIESTIDAIRASEFRPFSAKQSQEGNRVTYEVSLIRQASNAIKVDSTETVAPNE